MDDWERVYIVCKILEIDGVEGSCVFFVLFVSYRCLYSDDIWCLCVVVLLIVEFGFNFFIVKEEIV